VLPPNDSNQPEQGQEW